MSLMTAALVVSTPAIREDALTLVNQYLTLGEAEPAIETFTVFSAAQLSLPPLPPRARRPQVLPTMRFERAYELYIVSWLVQAIPPGVWPSSISTVLSTTVLR